jgi:hypothetical protein
MSNLVTSYLSYMLSAELASEPLPVDFDLVWPFVYPTRTIAKRALLDTAEFCEGTDYQIQNAADHMRAQHGAGVSEEKIMLSIQCLEYFIARNDRLVFEVYRQCRKLVTQKL